MKIPDSTQDYKRLAMGGQTIFAESYLGVKGEFCHIST
jgi:hypothetical protein